MITMITKSNWQVNNIQTEEKCEHFWRQPANMRKTLIVRWWHKQLMTNKNLKPSSECFPSIIENSLWALPWPTARRRLLAPTFIRNLFMPKLLHQLWLLYFSHFWSKWICHDWILGRSIDSYALRWLLSPAQWQSHDNWFHFDDTEWGNCSSKMQNLILPMSVSRKRTT